MNLCNIGVKIFTIVVIKDLSFCYYKNAKFAPDDAKKFLILLIRFLILLVSYSGLFYPDQEYFSATWEKVLKIKQDDYERGMIIL